MKLPVVRFKVFTEKDTVRSNALKVAISATGIIAAVYLLIAATIYVVVSSSLTGELDQRVETALQNIEQGQNPYLGQYDQPNENPYGTPDGSNQFGPPILIWVETPNGIIEGNDPTVVLPPSVMNVSSPESVSIQGTTLRVNGMSLDGGRIIVGVTADTVERSLGSLLFGESIVFPALLLLVFAGSMIVGLKVARPIEAVRKRQLAFTADASHELRTPLAVIEAQTALALSQKRKPGEYQQALEHIGNESARMRHLLEELLWLARFDERGAQSPPELVDLVSLVRNAGDRFGALAEAKGQKLSIDTKSELAMVSIVPEWIDRLLGALLDNAIKYTPEGGMVTVVVREAGGRAVLAVEDSGPGIAEKELPSIFDRFHRASAEASGAGLGLSIANSIVTASQGRWDIGHGALGGLSMEVSWPLAGQ